MPGSTTMTIRVRPDVKEKLDQLAIDTHRSRSYLAAQALAAYVEREMRIMDGIRQGIDDADAGHVVTHDDAMDEIDAMIDAVEAARAART